MLGLIVGKRVIWLLVMEVETLDCTFMFKFTTTLPLIKAHESKPEVAFANIDIIIFLRNMRDQLTVRRRPR